MARASVTGKLMESGIPLKKNKHYDAKITEAMLMEKTGSVLVKMEVTGSGDDKDFNSEGYEVQDFIELNLAKDFPSKTVEGLVKRKTGSFFDATGVDASDFDTDELVHKNLAFMGYSKDDGYEIKFMINQYYHSQG